MSAAESDAPRPFCAESARAAGESLAATASRVEHWVLVEYGGYWPAEPLDAAVFAGSLREHLAAQVRRLRNGRLLLVKRPRRARTDGVTVMVGRSAERGSGVRRIEVEGHPDLLDLDLETALRDGGGPAWESVEHPLLLVCTHGVRDRCCARYGQALLRAAHRHADPEWIWQTTHVGGDRFAGNLVLLPEGLYFGWVEGGRAKEVLDAYRAGRIHLGCYRGRSCHPFPAQAADAHVRAATGLDGLFDLRLLGGRTTGEGTWTVELLAEVAGVVHEVDVVREHGEPTFLTCKSDVPRGPRRFAARAHRTRNA